MRKNIINSAQEIKVSTKLNKRHELFPHLMLGDLRSVVDERLQLLDGQNFVNRFWHKDPSLWNSDKMISNSMGWLDVVEKMFFSINRLENLYTDVKEAGFTNVVLLGMGGSSLAPFVLSKIFANHSKGLELTVLDTTNPETVAEISSNINIEKTLFILASKSGTTAEPIAFYEYFFNKVKEVKGDQAGSHFIVITDPNTPMVPLAKAERFRDVFINFSDIGGRYSALSFFGLVPAALLGIDIRELLIRANSIVKACGTDYYADQNPSVILGSALGELAKKGIDKLTLVMSESLKGFDLWIEQLVAESTGKEGKGILPIEANLNRIDSFGKDRVFVYTKVKSDSDELIEEKLQALLEDGHHVITIEMEDIYDIGREFYRWEFTTAVVGAVLEVNPFDQPNVQETKTITDNFLREIQNTGAIADQFFTSESGSLKMLYEEQLEGTNAMGEFLNQVKEGDYISLLCYIPEDKDSEKRLNEIKALLEKQKNVAVTIGYGPRYLHSTGQFHKGGPKTGHFIMLTSSADIDAMIPGRTYGFKSLCAAQARGDYEAIKAHNSEIIHIDLGKEISIGLTELKSLVQKKNVIVS